MVKKGKILIIGFVLSLPSCQKQLDIDIDYEPQMVMVGILVPGKQVEVKLTSNIPIKEKITEVPIEGATVSLFEGSTLLGNLTYSLDSTYILDSPIVQGKAYTLRATSSGYPPIEATTTVPLSQNFKITKEVYVDDGPSYDFVTSMSITFPESSTTSYYGIFSFNKKEILDGFETVTTYYGSGVKANHYVEFIDQSVYWGSYKDIPKDFTDINVNLELYTHNPNDREAWGGKYVFLSNIPFAGNEFTINEKGYGYSADSEEFINIYLMSPELYKSFKGIAAQNSTSNSLVVTPVPAYNSIIGGLGYFGSVVVHTINLNENTTFYKK